MGVQSQTHRVSPERCPFHRTAEPRVTAMTSQPKRQPPRQVDIVKPTYQPSKAELNEDARVNATFEEAVDALTRPVQINYIPRPKSRR